ncbi:Uncharacterized protein PHSC3_002019 [Chlamydiales bacterium STE3]|nr:Uncharacterized protein PHSC3_002019 [Chlamydiales bacterium STE3]
MKKSFVQNTSWEKVDKWYNNTVGEKGHYYHQHVIFPQLFKIINLKKIKTLLDLGCGQGVLSRYLPGHISYLGVDLSPSLIKNAKKAAKYETQQFIVRDVTQELSIDQKEFDLATMILSLQNMKDPLAAFKNAANYLKKEGSLVLVLNHPCYRIPRQSSWQVDQAKKIQYRRVDCYMSPLTIPIDTHPGKKQEASSETWSFHHPLSNFFKWLSQAGFVITYLDEWCSDKESTGGAAKMENRSRLEFPLFMTIIAKKKEQ